MFFVFLFFVSLRTHRSFQVARVGVSEARRHELLDEFDAEKKDHKKHIMKLSTVRSRRNGAGHALRYPVLKEANNVPGPNGWRIRRVDRWTNLFSRDEPGQPSCEDSLQLKHCTKEFVAQFKFTLPETEILELDY